MIDMCAPFNKETRDFHLIAEYSPDQWRYPVGIGLINGRSNI
jgi:hypothetical protein